MPTYKTHAKVDRLKAEREAAIDALYYTDVTGQRGPKYAPNVHAEKQREIDERYDAALLALVDEAQAAADATDAVLTRPVNPYAWLNGPEEEARAARLAPFFREDVARLDVAGVLGVMQTAAGNSDRVARWLIFRYGAQRWQELDGDEATAPGIVERAKWPAVVAAMRGELMPTAERKERDEAQRKLDDAKTLCEVAEWARPSVRQEFAARMGLNAEYMPD